MLSEPLWRGFSLGIGGMKKPLGGGVEAISCLTTSPFRQPQSRFPPSSGLSSSMIRLPRSLLEEIGSSAPAHSGTYLVHTTPSVEKS